MEFIWSNNVCTIFYIYYTFDPTLFHNNYKKPYLTWTLTHDCHYLTCVTVRSLIASSSTITIIRSYTVSACCCILTYARCTLIVIYKCNIDKIKNSEKLTVRGIFWKKVDIILDSLTKAILAREMKSICPKTSSMTRKCHNHVSNTNQML